MGREAFKTRRHRRAKDPDPARTMNTRTQVLELLGVLVSAGALICSLTCTLMTSWLTMSTELLTTETYELGLWETCVVQDLGGLECRPHDSLLGLRPDIRLARVLMCAALGAGLMGLLLAVPGLHLVNSCQQLRCKKALKAAGGGLGLLAGVLGLVPVSLIAHGTVIRFFDESVPDVVPRWEFGDALFCGWTAGFLHLAAGTLLLTSCLCEQDPPAPVPRTFIRSRTRTEYV